MKFKVKERTFLSTSMFSPTSTEQPGTIIKWIADPIKALIGQDATGTGRVPYVTGLGMTMSRYREIRYYGTRISFVPAASTNVTDPAHISEPVGGVQPTTTLGPRDTGNCIHVRKWLGDPIDLPYITPADATGKYTADESQALDVAWMSDPRFSHINVGDGFSLFARPLKASVDTAAVASQSLFAYASPLSVGPVYTGDRKSTVDYHPDSFNALTSAPRHLHDQGWVINPLAGLTFKQRKSGEELVDINPYDPQYEISGYLAHYPWFGDAYNVKSTISLATLLDWIRRRFQAPVCIIRIPPAYGSIYYWTVYAIHYFGARKLITVNAHFSASQVTIMHHGRISVNGTDKLSMYGGDEIPMTQVMAVDPYACSETGHVMTMHDELEDLYPPLEVTDNPPSIWQMSPDQEIIVHTSDGRDVPYKSLEPDNLDVEDDIDDDSVFDGDGIDGSDADSRSDNVDTAPKKVEEQPKDGNTSR